MVTIRRNNESCANIDRIANSITLTDYDRFLLGKQEKTFSNEKDFYDVDDYSSSYEAVSNNDMVMSSSAQSYDDYDQYMESVLNRTSKTEKVLTREEFLDSKKKAVGQNKKSQAVSKIPGKLTKYGKIFVATYVLVVAIVAFMLIAVNTFLKKPVVDAEEHTVETVESMDDDNNEDFVKWFE